MAIIRYQLDNGNTPAYITNGGYLRNSDNETLIGIGSGGGTELTQAELLTYIKAMGIRKEVWADSDGREVSERNAPLTHIKTHVAMTDSECETIRDAWLSQMGIS